MPNENAKLLVTDATKKYFSKNWLLLLTIVSFFLNFSTPAPAASVSFFLDQSSRLSGGTNYLKVTIDDQGPIAGSINFTIQTLFPISNTFSCNLGLDQFGFNGVELDKSNIFGLPDGWSFKNEKTMGSFGRFENVLTGTAWTTHDPLRFSIVGIKNDSLYSYATSHDGNNGVLFAALIGSIKHRGDGEWRHDQDGSCHECSLRDAYIGGGTPYAVPVPGSALLFGSGLLVLAGISRRER